MRNIQLDNPLQPAPILETRNNSSYRNRTYIRTYPKFTNVRQNRVNIATHARYRPIPASPTKEHEVTASTHTPTPEDLPRALSAKIQIDMSDHWIWIGNYNSDGFPLLGSKMAHSAIYRHLYPESNHLDGRILRTCGNKNCVNPAHMRFPQADNGGLEARYSRKQSSIRSPFVVGSTKRIRVTGGKSVFVNVVDGGEDEEVEKVQDVQNVPNNNSDLVKVLQRIAEVLERMEAKTP